MVNTVKSYKVTYERDEAGWWVATVHGVPGVHTQGRTIGDARHRIREALALEIGDHAAETAALKDNVKLPSEVRRILKESIKQKFRAEAQKAKAQKIQVQALRKLQQLHLSRRDVGELMGVSHQRIQQLMTKNREADA